MMRPLNKIEKKKVKIAIERLEADKEEMVSDISFFEFMIEDRLYKNYKRTLRDYVKKKKILTGEVNTMTKNLLILYNQLKNGVKVKKKLPGSPLFKDKNKEEKKNDKIKR